MNLCIGPKKLTRGEQALLTGLHWMAAARIRRTHSVDYTRHPPGRHIPGKPSLPQVPVLDVHPVPDRHNRGMDFRSKEVEVYLTPYPFPACQHPVYEHSGDSRRTPFHPTRFICLASCL